MKKGTPEELKQQKEQSIINKCKFLDERLVKYKEWKKKHKKLKLTYKEYCYPIEYNQDYNEDNEDFFQPSW